MFDIRSFVGPVSDALRTMGGVKADVTAPAGPVPVPVFADVSSSLVLRGPRDVTMVLTMTERAAICLAERVGIAAHEIDEAIVGDLAGELLNVICGSLQKVEKFAFAFGIPSTATGKHHEVTPLRGGFGERLVSQSNDGDLELFVVDGVA